MRAIQVLILILLVPFMFAGIVTAQDVRGRTCTVENSSFLGLPAWYKYLEAREDTSGRCNPVLSKDTNGRIDPSSALPIGIAVLEGFIRLGGLVAVVMIFIGGFRFITSQGNPESAASARKTAINALIGLVIVIVATSVVSFIGNRLG